MAAANPNRGDMEIGEQERTYGGFLQITVWGSALVAVGVLYFTLVFAVGAPWFQSLIGVAVLGGVGGFLMKMGGAWYATLVGLVALGSIIGFVTTLLISLGAS